MARLSRCRKLLGKEASREGSCLGQWLTVWVAVSTEPETWLIDSRSANKGMRERPPNDAIVVGDVRMYR